MHLNLYVNLAHRAYDGVGGEDGVFVSNQMASKSLCDLHSRSSPSNTHVKIFPWNPSFYTPSTPQPYLLSYLDKTGTDLQEKYFLYLSQLHHLHSQTPTSHIPTHLFLVSSGNPITMKKVHKEISKLEVTKENTKFRYKFEGKYFVGIDDRRPVE